MDPAYVVKYAELYRRHWWWRSREKLTLKWLEQLKPESGFGLILDVGSGSGLFLEALSRFGQPEGVEADGAWAKHPTPGAGRVHYRPFDATFRPNRRYGSRSSFGTIRGPSLSPPLTIRVMGSQRAANLHMDQQPPPEIL